MSIKKAVLVVAANLLLLGLFAPAYASDVILGPQASNERQTKQSDSSQPHGYYSYTPSDVLGSASRPPWLAPDQSAGGPFDSGFFFDSGTSPDGSNAPYQH